MLFDNMKAATLLSLIVTVKCGSLVRGFGLTYRDVAALRQTHPRAIHFSSVRTRRVLAASSAVGDSFASNINATSYFPLGSQDGQDRSSLAEKERPSFPIVLWRFTRPHTLIGSALAIPAIHMLAAPSFQEIFSYPTLVSIIYAMVPSLLMNLYITGLNQITDVEIDKINKPDLPIAAGDLSPGTAILTVLIALVASLWMGVAHPVLGSQGLNVALWGSAILGTMYSLPPFRLKRFHLLAAFCIVAVRGTIINAGFFAHAQAASFGNSAATVIGCLLSDRKCFLSSLFFGVFGIVIALMKDVPDVEGDEISNIRSFSVRFGQKRIFKTMRRLLTTLFFMFGGGFLRASLSAPSKIVAGCRAAVGLLSFAAGISTRREALEVDPEDSAEVYKYYMHLWKLFYMSYLLLPLVR